LDDLRTVVAGFFGNGLGIVAVDDLAPGTVAIDGDRHQDAVDGDVVPEGEELLVGQGGQLQDRGVHRHAALLGGRRRWQAPRGAGFRQL
jgi:hypothetical protein